MMLVADKSFMLDHLGGVVNYSPDLSSDLDLPQRYHHGAYGSLSSLPSRKQMPKLQQAWVSFSMS